MKLLRWVGALIRSSLGNSIFIMVLAVVLIGWIAYTHATGDGIVTGTVIDAGGRPVAGATVMLRDKTLDLIKPPIETRTNASGVFTYHHIALISFFVSASKPGYVTSPRVHYHLCFETQHFKVPKPIVLTKGAGGG